MGVSNPSARGYAVPTYGSNDVNTRATFGGPAKAGTGRHIGMGQFTVAAIVNGAAGHPAPLIAGPFYPALGEAGLINPARNLLGQTIKLNGRTLYYPINFNNQLSNVGLMPRFGMFNPSADGVNLQHRLRGAEVVAGWNAIWPFRPVRGLSVPPIPGNPPPIAPGMLPPQP